MIRREYEVQHLDRIFIDLWFTSPSPKSTLEAVMSPVTELTVKTRQQAKTPLGDLDIIIELNENPSI